MTWEKWVSLAIVALQALVVFAHKASLENAILRAMEKIGEKFATKKELEKTESDLRREIDLKRTVEDGFSRLTAVSSKASVRP